MNRCIAYPQRIPDTPTTTLPVNAVEGDSVDLLCDVERSFLDQFVVTWYRSPSGAALVQLPNAANPDYSLTLNDLEVSQSGIYVCIVTANSSFLPDASTRSITGRSIDLIVRSRHSKFCTLMSNALLFLHTLTAWCFLTLFV